MRDRQGCDQDEAGEGPGTGREGLGPQARSGLPKGRIRGAGSQAGSCAAQGEMTRGDDSSQEASLRSPGLRPRGLRPPLPVDLGAGVGVESRVSGSTVSLKGLTGLFWGEGVVRKPCLPSQGLGKVLEPWEGPAWL